MKIIMDRKHYIVLALCLFTLGIVLFSGDAYAHRTWKKITKLPNGTYTVDKSIKESRPWWIKGIKLKIKGNKMTLNCSVQNKNGRVYCSDPLIMKFNKKCKYYLYGPLGRERGSKKEFLKGVKDNNSLGWTYDNLIKFKVKNNRIISIHMATD